MKENKFRVKYNDEYIYFDLNCLEILTSDEIEHIGGSDNKKEMFIGIKDIKGKDIYEGDILRVIVEDTFSAEEREIMGKVIYDIRSCSFMVKFNTDCLPLKDFIRKGIHIIEDKIFS